MLQKSNEQLMASMQTKQWDSVRYACIHRIKANPFDVAAWVYLGHAMIGLGRGKMATRCLQRATLLTPASHEWDALSHMANEMSEGRDDPQVIKLLHVPPATVSACILTRNNERTIAACMQALVGAVDELIVVDTGSTDDTLRILASMGIPTHVFQWEDNFSAARNFALSLATMDWIVSIDSDELLLNEDRDHLRLLAGLYSSVSQPVILHLLQINHALGHPTESVPVPRMFPRNRSITWQNRIHEYPAPPIEVPWETFIHPRQYQFVSYTMGMMLVRWTRRRNIGGIWLFY